MKIQKIAKKYMTSLRAIQIIEEQEQIQNIEIVYILKSRYGIDTSTSKLGQLLKPFVSAGQIEKVKTRQGSFYSPIIE